MRIHPVTGEILFGIPTSGSGFPLPNPRGFAIDTSGAVVVASVSSGIVSSLAVAAPSFEDRSFNSIRSLNRPLLFQYGGNPWVGATYGHGTINLSPSSLTAMVESNSGSTTVFLLSSTYVQPNHVVVVVDIGEDAGTNNISVNGNGLSVENPAAPGSFASSVTLSTSGQSVAWIYDSVNSRYKFLFANGGGAGGIYVDNNGADIGGNPHTVLNFTTNMTATNAGGGVADISVSISTLLTAPLGYVLVGNANPSTGTLDSTHLQAIVDTSAGLTTVNAPDLTTPSIQQLFRVTDDTATAATNPITVQSQASRNIEDPNNHGHYATSVQITVNSQSIHWEWTGSHYKIV